MSKNKKSYQPIVRQLTEPLLKTDAAIYWSDATIIAQPLTGGFTVDKKLTRVERHSKPSPLKSH